MVETFYRSTDRKFTLLLGDNLCVLPQFDFKFDMIFADPPYFLSNGGFSVHNGKKCCVDKGDWDKLPPEQNMDSFNEEWLRLVEDKLKINGTIWVTATHHNLFSIGHLLTEMNYKILNVICWEKIEPPPNLSHRSFTYSHEFLIWARRLSDVQHYFNYELMQEMNNGYPMEDVWRLPSVATWEKSCGKHPTQKPLKLIYRAIQSCTVEGDWILDPFCGSGTTGIAANLCDRRFLGIDRNIEFVKLSKLRKLEIEDATVYRKYLDFIR